MGRAMAKAKIYGVCGVKRIGWQWARRRGLTMCLGSWTRIRCLRLCLRPRVWVQVQVQSVNGSLEV